MNLFGRVISPQEIAAVVMGLMTLVVWLAALRGERSAYQAYRRWAGERNARKRMEAGEPLDAPQPSERDKRKGPPGPWG